ncbi:MAG: hypothetical protein II704_04175 [Erysipelotrichaceae bacterium]|nr:hypothetical protein [Erysipelotrichaceae bacterium]
MEFRNSPEYPGLPDEFNRGYRDTAPVEKRDNKLLKLILSFVTLTSVVFPLTVTHGHSHSHPDIPDIPDIPDVPIWVDPDPTPQVTEYSIVGKWEYGEEFYEFFEDGTGYWTNGQCFIFMDWEKEGNDYRVRGEGLTSYYEESMVIQRTDFVTSYDDGLNLMVLLYSYLDGDTSSSMGKFAESPRSYDLEKILPLRGKTISDLLDGSWEIVDYKDSTEDGTFYYLSYFSFAGGKAKFDFISLISDENAQFEANYAPAPDYPKYEIKVGEGQEIYIIFAKDNTSHVTGSDWGFPVYYFIDEQGPGLLVQPFTTWAIMRKMP